MYYNYYNIKQTDLAQTTSDATCPHSQPLTQGQHFPKTTQPVTLIYDTTKPVLFVSCVCVCGLNVPLPECTSHSASVAWSQC